MQRRLGLLPRRQLRHEPFRLRRLLRMPVPGDDRGVRKHARPFVGRPLLLMMNPDLVKTGSGQMYVRKVA